MLNSKQFPISFSTQNLKFKICFVEAANVLFQKEKPANDRFKGNGKKSRLRGGFFYENIIVGRVFYYAAGSGLPSLEIYNPKCTMAKAMEI